MKKRKINFRNGYLPANLFPVIVVVVALGLTSVAAFFPNRSPKPLLAAPAQKPTVESATLLPACQPNETPLGALPGQPAPIWCYQGLGKAPSTATRGTNSWLDEFDHGVSFGTFNDGENGYKVFNKVGDVNKAVHWRHADHWMVDVDPYGAKGDLTGRGGAMLRPDRTFKAENGKLVIETDVAAGVEGYDLEDSWPEIDITTAPDPNTPRGAAYGYDSFANHYTLGCRLHANRHPICSLFDTTARSTTKGGRIWEVGRYQKDKLPEVTLWGGNPTEGTGWRSCKGTDPDTNCRDRFRLEIMKDRLTLYVNGIKYWEAYGFRREMQVPDQLLNNAYVYFTSWTQEPQHKAVRFHWDRIAINPANGPIAAPGFSAEGTETDEQAPVPAHDHH